MHSFNQEDQFIWNGLAFYQSPAVFKIGTDSLLLCEWAKKLLISPRNILDVGSGSGILAGVLGNHFPNAHVTAIENETKSAVACRKNLQSVLRENQWKVFEVDFFQWDYQGVPFDVIISNPPYYFGGAHLPSAKFEKAKGSMVGTDTWMTTMKTKLANEGTILIVIPEESSFEWIRSAGESGCYCHHRLNVFSFQGDKKAKRVLLSFRNDLVRPQIKDLFIYEKENKYSQSYKTLMGL